ncbi:ankyrin repeat domain-containing protein [Planctomycetes bacterium TBK1r]|uniref:Phosphocholine transferase AnkX n=1 Tax=Stieleria magnilauensis TaxID=2527963 RepID=A0ABX5XPU6_9BACT|nr:Phosphocholine transferase AnkX [Planctomycetes bacterium TBK1r]
MNRFVEKHAGESTTQRTHSRIFAIAVCSLCLGVLPSGVVVLAAEPELTAESKSATEPELADAVEKQDRKRIAELLSRVSTDAGDDAVDIDATQVDGMTALHWAVYLDDVETCHAIVNAGASVDCQNRYGVTPLSLACSNGNRQLVKLLLEHGTDANATLDGGETALMTAARTGRVDPVRALLKHGADVNATERNDQTALMWAAHEGHAEVVDLLLDAGADFETALKSGYTPMMFAVRQGHWPVVKRFLDAGVDVNLAMKPANSSGKNVANRTSPLILAIENGHFELAVELLKAGADPNDQRTGFSPLFTMSWVRKPPLGDNADGDPPPIGSGSMTSLQFVRALVEHGADVNAPKERNGGRGKFGKKGATAFFAAAGTADVALMQTLLELGADPTLAADNGWTPLMMAAGMGSGSEGDTAGSEPECLAAVSYLIDLGADVNAVDSNGETAMHGAAYKMLPSVVNCLAANGADINIWSKVTKQGRMPLWIAMGYRGGGNFKPSYETADAIRALMIAEGITPPPPPKQKLEKGYRRGGV